MATQAQVKAFIEMLAPIVIDVCKSKTRQVLPSVAIAQACCESAYGTSKTMVAANAVFGIKVGGKTHFGTAWKDKAYSTKTNECYDGKTYTQITDMFRAYDSIRDSVEDYYDLLGVSSRYAGCIGELDPVKSITAIKNGGYATSPTYITTITSIIKSNNLTQYDYCMNPNITEIPAVNVTTSTKYKLGETVTVNGYYSSSSSLTGKVSRVKTGIISRIIEGRQHPYCISIKNVAIGWSDDSCIVENSTTTENNTSSNTQSSTTTSNADTHLVVSGDTLCKLSSKYGVSIDTILSNNKAAYPSISRNFIRVGWKLNVSGNTEKVYHTVVKGDTLSKISTKYGVSIDAIIDFNKSTHKTITRNFIITGWKLRVK